MRGGYRPNSGVKKGNIPWNKNINNGINKQCFTCGEDVYEYPSEIRKYCSHKCANKQPWNVGLTKKTDKRLKRLSEKVSVSLKKLYKENPELHPNRTMCNVSKPQKELYLLLKEKYIDAQLEYPIKTKHSLRFADIAIPSLKLDIEYDGGYWHKNKQLDNLRDKHLSEVGWTTIRINENNIKIKVNELLK